MKILVWVATPFTSGCPWKHINSAKVFVTGDPALSSRLIKHASKVCRLARLLGGSLCVGVALEVRLLERLEGQSLDP